MKDPLVSVIITTRNSQRTLQACLLSVKKQTYRKIEIIVVDNHSKDNTQKIAEKYAHSVYIKGPERSTQRNWGAKKATVTLFYFWTPICSYLPK